MNSLIVRIATVAVLVFGAGCQPAREDPRVADLEREVAKTKTEIEDLKLTVQVLESQRKDADPEKVAYLEPGNEGYQTVRYDLGSVTIQLVDVAPFANGSKVTLRFGNPLASTVDGLHGEIDWGRLDANGLIDNSNAKSKKFALVESLSPGSWTNTAIVLDSIPPTDLAFIRIREIGHDGVQLRRQQSNQP